MWATGRVAPDGDRSDKVRKQTIFPQRITAARIAKECTRAKEIENPSDFSLQRRRPAKDIVGKRHATPVKRVRSQVPRVEQCQRQRNLLGTSWAVTGPQPVGRRGRFQHPRGCPQIYSGHGRPGNAPQNAR